MDLRLKVLTVSSVMITVNFVMLVIKTFVRSVMPRLLVNLSCFMTRLAGRSAHLSFILTQLRPNVMHVLVLVIIVSLLPSVPAASRMELMISSISWGPPA